MTRDLVLTAEQSRSLDKRIMDHPGIPGSVMMENAATAAQIALCRLLGDLANRKILILCGPGNNGGDGFALARKVLAVGALPEIWYWLGRDKLSDDAAFQYQIVRNLSIPIYKKSETDGINFLKYDILVDALFGTGLQRPLEGVFATAVDVLNASGRPVLSLDLPSGISADTGQILGTSVRAEATVSFGTLKRGHCLYPGTASCGKIFLGSLSFPPDCDQGMTDVLNINSPVSLPERPSDGYKSTFGHLLIIGGSGNYRGAPYLAATGALASGAGFLTAAVPPELKTDFWDAPEMVYADILCENGTELGPESENGILSCLDKADAAVIGPGLSLEESSRKLAVSLLPKLMLPLVIDGDALSVLAGNPGLRSGMNTETVLTAHPGELARLLDLSVQSVVEDPIGSAIKAAEKYQSVCLCKGARTIVTSPQGETFCNITGNSGLGTAGSGDVLSGIIGRFLAVGLPALEAARCGVYLHGYAADLASRKLGEDGLTPHDLAAYIPIALKRYRKGKTPAFPELLC